jgi:hypothetical protein
MQWATFIDGNVFGRDISRFSSDQLRAMLRLYNVTWIVAHSPNAKTVFDQAGWCTLRFEYAPIRIYEMKEAGAFFIEGKGHVLSRAPNLVTLSTESTGPITLSYHWVPGLHTEPETQLEKRMLQDDPVPFVHLPNPPPRFDLKVGP